MVRGVRADVRPAFHWPLVGNTAVYHFIDEILGLGTVIGITTLIVIRQLNHPRVPARLSRFSVPTSGPRTSSRPSSSSRAWA